MVGDDWSISNYLINDDVNSLGHCGNVIDSLDHVSNMLNSWDLSYTLNNMWYIDNSLSCNWNHFDVCFDVLSVDGDVIDNVLYSVNGSSDWNGSSDGSCNWNGSDDVSGNWMNSSNVLDMLLNMVDSDCGSDWGSSNSN